MSTMVGGQSKRRRLVGDRGVAVVEAALVTPIMAVLLLGVIEAGWFLKAHLSVEQATSYGARVGAVAGADPAADVAVLDEIEHRLIDGRANVERVVVYLAADSESPPPAGCLTGNGSGSVADACTVYRPADFDATAATLTCVWCPADRTPTELLGVYLRYDYQAITGIVSTRELSGFDVLPIEYPAVPR